MLSLEIGVDLAREELEGTSKVVIVSFYILFLEFQGFVIILI